MTPHTQSNLSPGNCWQTAVASVLDVDPASMPAQCDHERIEDGKHVGSYHNPLNAYLRHHHGLVYAQLWPQFFPVLLLREPGYHVIVGETVRTAEHGRSHAVVGRHGEVVWDPHPSRAGLTKVTAWGLLVPFPAEWAETWNTMMVCQCPACVLDGRPST